MGNNKSNNSENNKVQGQTVKKESKQKKQKKEDHFIDLSQLSDNNLFSSIGNELMLNIDSSDHTKIDPLLDIQEDLSKKITSLHLKTILQAKQDIPINQIIDLLQRFSDENILNKLSIKFEFINLEYDNFERIVKQIQNLSNLNYLYLRLNNNILQRERSFLQSYVLSLQNKNTLKELDLLISFKNTFITRQNFDVYLDTFHSIKSLERMTLSIENSVYYDLALDVIYSIISHPHLVYIQIYLWQYNSTPDETLKLEKGFLKYEQQNIHASQLQQIHLSQLKSNNAHVFFSLLSNLPKIKKVQVNFIETNKKQDIKMRQIQQFSEKVKHLKELNIEFNENIESEMLKQILSYFPHFIAYEFYCEFNDYRSSYKLSVLNKYQVMSSLLSIVWNKVSIFNAETYTQMVDYYLIEKDIQLIQKIIFKKNIEQFMICNPQFILIDLYIS